ncbi:WG repeat-containing protein [Larkinella sp. VNQ87]|uniref:WG repeat-containing protein n=1 Tax=Larkinella sp. VNQ87 TaxID=3400921 RepID=UPI003C05920E
MTLEELRDRIKNEVVLYEGELADWQWRQKGLVAEANELGISDFTRLVNDISRQVNRDFGKILDLKKKIVAVALQRGKQLTEADIAQFVTEADRVQLSRAFVTEQWIPAILNALPETAATPIDPAKPAPVAEPTTPPISSVSETAPSVDKVEAVRKKIKSILDDYDKHIQAQSLKFLFKAVDYDEEALAEEIRRYLSENFYASVNPPRGNSLKEKLISTDWRHLSWWEKDQTKPTEYVRTATGYTTPPAPPETASLNRPPVVHELPRSSPPPPVVVPAPPKKSGLSDAALIGLAVLSALILIWVVLRLTRGEDEEDPVRKPSKNRTSQQRATYQIPKASAASLTPSRTVGGTEEDVPVLDETENQPIEKPASSFAQTNEDPPTRDFDKVDETVGEFGLRVASKNNRWGYINDKNNWVIEPQYELATPFTNGKASVELDGNQFFIDRYGNRIRDDN